MQKFIIKGPCQLHGEIKVNGAKNAALKIIPVSILSDEEITITNVPNIEDVQASIELIKYLGANIDFKDNICKIKINNLKTSRLDEEISGKIRTSIMFVGPILARTGEVFFPAPGGCNLASGAKRPFNFFLEGFEALGAKVNIDNDTFHIKAKKLIGGEYFFSTVSVTGTESLLMTATLAEGKTTLKNCAMEPEIKFLADYLNSCGAKIKGAGTPTITIDGVKTLSAKEVEVIPDRIEAGTFAIMAAATNSELKITNCNPSHLEILLKIFKNQNINFKTGSDWITIFKSKNIKPWDIKTHEYPGFPTDLQAPYTILATQAHGTSLIHETIYDRRLMYVDMLIQMGADITLCDPHRIVVQGPNKLLGKKLISPDIRAGIAMIIAGLIAEGTTEISNIYQIDRGYERIDERLSNLGANIKRKLD